MVPSEGPDSGWRDQVWQETLRIGKLLTGITDFPVSLLNFTREFEPIGGLSQNPHL